MARAVRPTRHTTLRFRDLLKDHDLAVDMLRAVDDILQTEGLMMRVGTTVDAALIAAPSSIKMPKANAIRQCIQPRKASSDTAR